MENLVRLHFIKVRPTGHRSAVEMNQREVRMSLLFKFKMFFKFTRYSTDYLHIGVRANIHLGGQTEFCPNGSELVGGGG